MIEYVQVNDWCQDDFLQLSKARDICSGSLALEREREIFILISQHKQTQQNR